MGMPFNPNTTCDICRHNQATPSYGAVPIFLTPDFVTAHAAAVQSGSTFARWTHLALCDTSVDIRDGYTTASTALENAESGFDFVYVPNKNTGTCFVVVYIERVGYGTGQDFLRVCLQRQTANWPTNFL